MVIVEGKIRGKQRPRMTRSGHVYTPNQTVTYEKQIKDCYKKQCGEFLEGEVKADIVAYYKVPKSYPKKRLCEIREGKDFPMKKPDIDNCIKVILDSLNGIAYKDDSQVVEIVASKRWTEKDERIEFKLENVKKGEISE